MNHNKGGMLKLIQICAFKLGFEDSFAIKKFIKTVDNIMGKGYKHKYAYKTYRYIMDCPFKLILFK